MGSFTSSAKIANEDSQDSHSPIWPDLPDQISRGELLARCRSETTTIPSLVRRQFKIADTFSKAPGSVPLTRLSKVCSEAVSSPSQIRIMQWNVLSQALGQMNDSFACLPENALDWETRKFHMLEELIEYSPDVICLQEVDHFRFLKRMLGTQGYAGVFFPKPDSPCLYLPGNNGPDGCAIFYRSDKFDFLKMETRILEVWRVQSNQVAVFVKLRVRDSGQIICISTTHLKARNGALLSTLRNEQGKDLLEFVLNHSDDHPVILCGDFNAEPTEPVYSSIINNARLGLASAYATSNDGQEPPYTTWKIRDEGEVCHTIDYIFYTKRRLRVDATLDFPTGDQIGPCRVPSFIYPSDHFSLVCDFTLGQFDTPLSY